MNIGILEPLDFSTIALQKLSKIGAIENYNGENLENFLSNKDIIFVRLNFDINQELLKSAPNLKYICSPTTGLNHINVDFCENQGIEIISLKGETDFLNTIRATPEHTLGLIMALKRNYNFAFLNSNNPEWDRNPYRGYEIYGSSIGIIGFGRVGKILAKYLKNMGATVGFFDINNEIDQDGIQKFDSKESLIDACDTIVLCSSYSDEYGSIINEKEIDALKNKYFINTARAELTNELYLSQKALNGHFKGIAIDVIQNEQNQQNNLQNWLVAADKFNVIITPHIGGATYSSMNRTEDFITDKLAVNFEF